MKKEWILIPAACMTLVFAGIAEAQGNPRNVRHIPSARSNNVKIPQASSSRINRVSTPRVGSRPSSPRRNGSSNLGRNLGNRSFNNGNRSQYGGDKGRFGGLGGNGLLGGLLQEQFGGGYGGYGGHRGYDPHGGDKAYAKAYRDAAIANAVVNMVGIFATTQQQRQYAQVPVATGPRGHVERQRRLVQEGRTEEYQVWVPQYVIPATGEVVVGHHETRRREIAPVYEDREVWVPTP